MDWERYISYVQKSLAAASGDRERFLREIVLILAQQAQKEELARA